MSLKRLNVEKNTGYSFFPESSSSQNKHKGLLIMGNVLIMGVIIMSGDSNLFAESYYCVSSILL